MKRSLPGLSGLHTRSVLAAASRSLHFSRSANFCPRLPRASCELSRGYTTPKRKRATVRWPYLFSKALCPRPKLFDLITLAEFLAAERSNTLLKKGMVVSLGRVSNGATTESIVWRPRPERMRVRALVRLTGTLLSKMESGNRLAWAAVYAYVAGYRLRECPRGRTLRET